MLTPSAATCNCNFQVCQRVLQCSGICEVSGFHNKVLLDKLYRNSRIIVIKSSLHGPKRIGYERSYDIDSRELKTEIKGMK